MGAVGHAQHAARSARRHPLRQPLRPISRQPQYAGANRAPAGGRDHPQRRPASAGRWQRVRAWQSHQPGAGVGLQRPVHAAALRQPADRGQPERPRAPDCLRAAGHPGAHSIAIRGGAAGGLEPVAEGIPADDSGRHRSCRAGLCDDGRVGQHSRAADKGAGAPQRAVAVSRFCGAEEGDGRARCAGSRRVRRI